MLVAAMGEHDFKMALARCFINVSTLLTLLSVFLSVSFCLSLCLCLSVSVSVCLPSLPLPPSPASPLPPFLVSKSVVDPQNYATILKQGFADVHHSHEALPALSVQLFTR